MKPSPTWLRSLPKGALFWVLDASVTLWETTNSIGGHSLALRRGKIAHEGDAVYEADDNWADTADAVLLDEEATLRARALLALAPEQVWVKRPRRR